MIRDRSFCLHPLSVFAPLCGSLSASLFIYPPHGPTSRPCFFHSSLTQTGFSSPPFDSGPIQRSLLFPLISAGALPRSPVWRDSYSVQFFDDNGHGTDEVSGLVLFSNFSLLLLRIKPIPPFCRCWSECPFLGMGLFPIQLKPRTQNNNFCSRVIREAFPIFQSKNLFFFFSPRFP